MNVVDELTKLSLQVGPTRLFDRVLAADGVFYRLEQRGTPEPTRDEKRSILEELYTTNPQLFISRYHSYMTVEDCDCFDKSDYEIAFYAEAIAQRCKNAGKKAKKDIEIRNQRYAEMQRLKRETDYFSDAKMREREPVLFDKMVGQFLPEEQQFNLRPTMESDSMSGMLKQFEDSQIISNRRNELLAKEMGNISDMGRLAQHASSRFCVEFDESDGEEGNGLRANPLYEKAEAMNDVSVSNPISNDEGGEEMKASGSDDDEFDQEVLRAEFVDHMEQRFLRGEDSEFYDYSCVGQASSKEYEKMKELDLEEAYFEND